MEQTKLLNEINRIDIHLSNLKAKYDYNKEQHTKKVLKRKSKGIEKSLHLLGCDFESSTTKTPQYLQFHRTFKAEIKKLLAPHTSEIEIGKPNHFDFSGFFKLNSGDIYYISVGDLRWDKTFLIRTATDFKDFSGGSNNFLNLDKTFEEMLFKFLGVE
jgi:hypothetical protein